MRPHYNRPDRSEFTPERLSRLAKELGSVFYFLDDDSAIVVDGDNIKVVSEGKWERFE